MPHWTTPNPHSDDPTADAAKAITALQAELDKLLTQAETLTSEAISTLEGQVKTFYSEFEAHVADARKRLPAS